MVKSSIVAAIILTSQCLAAKTVDPIEKLNTFPVWQFEQKPDRTFCSDINMTCAQRQIAIERWAASTKPSDFVPVIPRETRLLAAFVDFKWRQSHRLKVQAKEQPREQVQAQEAILAAVQTSDDPAKLQELGVPSPAPPYRQFVTVHYSGVDTVRTEMGLEIIKDWDNGTIKASVNGRAIDPIIDLPPCNSCPESQPIDTAAFIRASMPQTWVQIIYTRYNAYVEQNYYNTNQANIIDFLNKLEPRHVLMEQTTGWSSEKFGYGKLDLYVDTAGCWGGYAMPGEAHLLMSNPLYQQSCKQPYYLNGQQQWNNPGELGDNWIYFSGGLHETLHSINPIPVYNRLWLTEGFSQYNMYNILTTNGDINQETSNTRIHNGQTGWQWEPYVSNNYRDTTVNNNEIQNSPGYDITAWMFTMLRDDYGLNFDRFYNLVNNNLETLDKADGETNWQHSDDMTVLDLFGRSISRDFNQTKAIFQYDGPNGPGWGVRQWVPRDPYYADLWPQFAPADTLVALGQNLSCTIRNTGQTTLVQVPVAVYIDGLQADSTSINVNAQSSTPLSISLPQVLGTHSVEVRVDEPNIKLDINEENNNATLSVRVSCCKVRTGNVDCDPADGTDISDLSALIDNLYITFTPLCCSAEANVDGQPGIDISDLSALIDYLYISFTPPAACQ